MAITVYANGREIACKSSSGKVIAAFPDVCLTPPDKVPPTPPGVPIPYPLTSLASDSNEGTKKVLIDGKELMKRDSSNFKKCAGDDAAQTAKKGIISSKLTGKVFFTSWSMNVKTEGLNVVRHLDTTTSNHSSPNANAACPWPKLSAIGTGKAKNKPCKGCEKKGKEQTVEEYDELAGKMRSGKRYKATLKKLRDPVKKCYTCRAAPGTSPDHIIPIKEITKIPGFLCLDTADQKRIVNHQSNFVGLCGPCNKSKGKKLWKDWSGHSKKGLHRNVRKKEVIKRSNKIHAEIKKAVKSADCPG